MVKGSKYGIEFYMKVLILNFIHSCQKTCNPGKAGIWEIKKKPAILTNYFALSS